MVMADLSSVSRLFSSIVPEVSNTMVRAPVAERAGAGIMQVGDDVNISLTPTGGEPSKTFGAREGDEIFGRCDARACGKGERRQAGGEPVQSSAKGGIGLAATIYSLGWRFDAS